MRRRPSPAAAGKGASTGQWLSLAVLIAAGPGLTLIGAKLLTIREERESNRLETKLEPRAARTAATAEVRQILTPLVRRKPLAMTLDRLAVALPADATLIGALQGRDGIVKLEVAAPDPDRLRAALRRAPGLEGLRDVGQRSGDGGIVVMLSGRVL